ncbi:MAG: RluA family pseudouridine synthase [Clostridiales bacterium]|nr:RluA family pseudouridine synthase [Clostridiales bacterium]
MKLYTFHIPEDTAAGKLLPLVRRMLPELDAKTVQKAFDCRDVKQNGKRMDKHAMLIPGAEVRLYTREEAAAGLSIPFVYEDENILIVHKPAGISCQKDTKGGLTIGELAARQLGLSQPLRPCHRLDNQTEGLLILAKTDEAREAMEEAFYHRRIHKQYLCMVKGHPSPEHAVLRDWLIKDEKLAQVKIVKREQPRSLPVVTEYQVLEQRGDATLVEITLHTGRTHQIRAHMAAIGHPLLGDDKYGNRDFNKQKKAKSLMLCAVSLSFDLTGRWSYLNLIHPRTKPSFLKGDK